MSEGGARTVLIGLDGATFSIMDDLMIRGVMPFLRDFSRQGVRATLRTVTPPLTPPGWTSLMTGKRPGQHGAFDFFQKESPDSEYFRLTDSRDVGSATVWSLASDEGRRVLVLNYPLTFPAPAVNGCVVPGGWMPWRQLRLGCHPPDLFDRLKAIPSFKARELALDMGLEEKAMEGCPDDEYVDWITLHTRRERLWLDIYQTLMQEEPADLIGLVFDGVDKLQHLCWRFIDPLSRPKDPSPWEQTIIGLCETYFRQLDEVIAEIVSQAGPQATVVFASDHGFGPSSDVFYVNSWLEQEGYLAWADGRAIAATAGTKVGFRQITRHIHDLDWQRTRAYAATPSSNGIHLVVPSGAGGSSEEPDAYRRTVTDLVAALRRVRHPLTGEALIADVHTREEVFSGPYEFLAPDLSLTIANGGSISILRSDTLVRRRPEVVGVHRPEGIFLAVGPGIRAGVEVDELSIVDVAPLLLHSLGLPIPDDVAGRVPHEVFEPEWWQNHRPVSTAGQPAVTPAPVTSPDATYDAESEAIMMTRLRALGYVE